MLGVGCLSSTTFCKTGHIAQRRGNLGKRGRPSRAQVAVRAYSVTFKMPEGEEKTIECDADTYILDKADEDGIDLPYSCRAGSCSSCAAKIVSGELDQSDQTFLDEAAQAKGFALICVSYPSSDLVLETHQEENIM